MAFSVVGIVNNITLYSWLVGKWSLPMVMAFGNLVTLAT